jgi:hypothetical protein
MSSISQQSFEQALHHAQTVEAHGKAFQEMAKSLEGRLLTTEQAEFMNQTGQQIQQHGQIMLALAEEALQEGESDLLETYILVHQQHCQAVLLHIKVIQKMLQAAKFALL